MAAFDLWGDFGFASDTFVRGRLDGFHVFDLEGYGIDVSAYFLA